MLKVLLFMLGTPSAVWVPLCWAQAYTRHVRVHARPSPRRRATRTQSHRGLHCPSHLAPRRVGVLVPLLLSINTRCPQRLLREGLVTPVALVSALWLPLVLVTPVELALTYSHSKNIFNFSISIKLNVSSTIDFVNELYNLW